MLVGIVFIIEHRNTKYDIMLKESTELITTLTQASKICHKQFNVNQCRVVFLPRSTKYISLVYVDKDGAPRTYKDIVHEIKQTKNPRDIQKGQ